MISNSKRTGILLAGLGLTFCCAFMCGMQIIICRTPVLDEFLLSPSISVFVGSDDYTITDLVTTSRGKVQEQLSFVDEADSQFVSAFYTCQNSECTLLEANIKVFVRRRMTCFFGGSSSSPDAPFGSTVTHISFDIANNELSAITHLRDEQRRNLLSWEELPLSIDEIMQVALETEGAEYAREHPEFELGVILLGDRWTLTFRSGATTVPDIRLHIDYNGKLIAE